MQVLLQMPVCPAALASFIKGTMQVMGVAYLNWASIGAALITISALLPEELLLARLYKRALAPMNLWQPSGYRFGWGMPLPSSCTAHQAQRVGSICHGAASILLLVAIVEYLFLGGWPTILCKLS